MQIRISIWEMVLRSSKILIVRLSKQAPLGILCKGKLVICYGSRARSPSPNQLDLGSPSPQHILLRSPTGLCSSSARLWSACSGLPWTGSGMPLQLPSTLHQPGLLHAAQRVDAHIGDLFTCMTLMERFVASLLLVLSVSILLQQSSNPC